MKLTPGDRLIIGPYVLDTLNAITAEAVDKVIEASADGESLSENKRANIRVAVQGKLFYASEPVGLDMLPSPMLKTGRWNDDIKAGRLINRLGYPLMKETRTAKGSIQRELNKDALQTLLADAQRHAQAQAGPEEDARLAREYCERLGRKDVLDEADIQDILPVRTPLAQPKPAEAEHAIAQGDRELIGAYFRHRATMLTKEFLDKEGIFAKNAREVAAVKYRQEYIHGGPPAG